MPWVALDYSGNDELKVIDYMSFTATFFHS